MANFKNRIRLPFYITQPQFPIEKTQFRFANGVTKTISATVRKTYIGKGDQMDEGMLQKMAVALVHDTVNIEGARYLGGVALESEFSIEYQDFIDFPLGIPTFTIQATPFFETNSNCQTCAEVTQLNLEDDEFYGDLDEGETASINVFTNDSICCSPIVAIISNFNSAYLDSASILPDGTLEVTVMNPAPAGTNILIATYRVTCPNGGYDEADVYATINGSEPACQPISNLTIEDMDADAGTATANFDLSPSSPGDGYDWYLYACDNLGLAVQAGNTAGSPINLTLLSPGGCYRLVVIAVCNQDVFYSPAVYTEFTMPSPESNCDVYLVSNTNYPDEPMARYTYMDCNGTLISRLVKAAPANICMLTDAFGAPIYFTSDGPGFADHYNLGPCP